MSEEIHEWINGQPPELREFARLLVERITAILASDRSVLLIEIDDLRQRVSELEGERAIQVADR